LSIEKYKYIKDNFKNVDISIFDCKFQKTFNSFYKIRRNKEWRDAFYKYFESIKKDENITFFKIINYLYENTDNVEASFASKMLATINEDMPIFKLCLKKT